MSCARWRSVWAVASRSNCTASGFVIIFVLLLATLEPHHEFPITSVEPHGGDAGATVHDPNRQRGTSDLLSNPGLIAPKFHPPHAPDIRTMSRGTKASSPFPPGCCFDEEGQDFGPEQPPRSRQPEVNTAAIGRNAILLYHGFPPGFNAAARASRVLTLGSPEL